MQKFQQPGNNQTDLSKQHSFTREELIRCGEGRLFSPDKARLPVAEMLMVDRILQINQDGGSKGKGRVVAEMDIHPDLWFFNCHFVDDPVMPGCLGLDALWQLTGFFLAWKGNPGIGRALGCGKVSFRGQILPSAKLITYELDIIQVREGRNIRGVADGTISVDGRKIYSAEGILVGLFISLEDF